MVMQNLKSIEDDHVSTSLWKCVCSKFYKLKDMQREELRLNQEKIRSKPTLEELYTIKDSVFKQIPLNFVESLNKGDDPKEKKILDDLCNLFYKLKDKKKENRKELNLEIASTSNYETPMVMPPNSSSHIIIVFSK